MLPKLAARELARKPTRARNQQRAIQAIAQERVEPTMLTKLAAREQAREPARGRNQRKENQAIADGMDRRFHFLQQAACCAMASFSGEA